MDAHELGDAADQAVEEAEGHDVAGSSSGLCLVKLRIGLLDPSRGSVNVSSFRPSSGVRPAPCSPARVPAEHTILAGVQPLWPAVPPGR